VSDPPPLAAAAERLRGNPGRPRLSDDERAKRAATRRANQALQLAAVVPRLFDVKGAARYLGGCSEWTVRALIARGTLARVVMPGANGSDLRRTFVDRQQLDELVLRWREVGR